MEGINAQEINVQHKITSFEFAAKFKSKREIFQLLTIDAGAYLPNYDCLTIYFLKDLIGGTKKCKCIFFQLSYMFTVIKDSKA